MDGVEFFRRSAGRWQSQRTTHHLAFRRAEMGSSAIEVVALEASDPAVIELCQFHQVDPALAGGGAHVSWQGSMAWDREDENHKGSSVMVLVPDPEDQRRGRLLRERGYAEVTPVAGQYHIDDEGGLNLTTEYETMSVVERFWFVSPDLRLRSSTVQRFGGFSTATFCSEVRASEDEASPVAQQSPATAAGAGGASPLGW